MGKGMGRVGGKQRTQEYIGFRRKGMNPRVGLEETVYTRVCYRRKGTNARAG
jgi:hypothetical protein